MDDETLENRHILSSEQMGPKSWFEKEFFFPTACYLKKKTCDLRFGFVNKMNMICYFNSYKSNHVFYNL